MLSIKNLSLEINSKKILNSISIDLKKGEKICILGPNGSGKSSLAQVIAGNFDCHNLNGKIIYNSQDLLKLTPDERSVEGIFVSYQMPIEIPGLLMATFLKTIVANKYQRKSLAGPTTKQILDTIKLNCDKLNLDNNFYKQNLNENFSGGERKKSEVLQMLMLEPTLVVLDEIDSGLDADTIKIISQVLRDYFKNSERSLILITHNLQFAKDLGIKIFYVLKDSKLVTSGNLEIIEKIKTKGYSNF